MKPTSLAAANFIFLLLLCFLSHAATGEPHPHLGKVAPFKAGDPGVKLGADALRVLQSGQPYRTQLQSGTAGRGMVVQDVHAPTDVVWGRILDFANYPQMVPKTVESQVYKREKLNRHGSERIFVRMKIGFPVLKLQFYVDHRYDPMQRSLTWTLDYSTKSDLDDSVGFWYVVPHPDDPQQKSRVYYSVEVCMFPWVPQFVVDFMSQQALVDATAWVKKYSELEAAKAGSGEGAAAVTNPESARYSSTERRRWWWGGRQRRPRRPEASSSSSSADESALASAAPNSDDSAPLHRLTATRYALVSSVLALSLYNVHLYFSQ